MVAVVIRFLRDVREVVRLRNEIRALKGKLQHARRQADPVLAVDKRHISSLQAKLHEHREAYKGLQAMQVDTWQELEKVTRECNALKARLSKWEKP